MDLQRKRRVDASSALPIRNKMGAVEELVMADYVEGVDTNRFRRKRLAQFLNRIRHLTENQDRIALIDIGGTISYWRSMQDLWQDLPLDITIVNLDVPESDDGPFHIRSGNACALSGYPDRSFDVAHSNSVIEHVGTWQNMVAMAGEIRRIAQLYYVQTPNFWFPIEPHYRTPFFQMCPENMRARMLLRKKRGFRGPHSSLDAAMRDVQSVALLDYGQMSALFPDAEIEREKVMGLTKSLIASR